MQYIVMQIGAPPTQQNNTGAYDVSSKDAVKSYFPSLPHAQKHAENQAAQNPGKQYGVFAPISIVETGKPTFIHKVLNDAGELVLKKES